MQLFLVTQALFFGTLLPKLGLRVPLVSKSFFLIALSVMATHADAESVRVLGQRGPLLVNRGVLAPRLRSAFFIAPNLISSNGKLFERDRFGRVRQLFFNSRTGGLVNFVEPDTVRQLGNIMSRHLSSLGGLQKQLATQFLGRLGMLPVPNASRTAGTPAIGPQCIDGPGRHGNTLCGNVPQDGRGAGPTRSLAETPFSAGVAQGGLCRDLHQSVCSGQSARSDEQAVGGAVRSLIQGFLKSTGTSFGTFSNLMSNVVRNSSQPALNSLYRRFFDHFSKQVPSLAGLFENVKGQVSKAVQNMPLSENAKQQMTARLQGVTLRTSPDFSKAQEIQDFAEACGPDGMAPGAFARFSEREVVVCPGLIMRALALGGTAELEHHLMHAIGHECTHHIGADIIRNESGQAIGQSPFRPEYQKVLGCYAANFQGIDPVRMGGEIAADIGAAKAMVERLRGFSPEEAFRFIKSSVGPLCGSENDGVHPSDKFRINVILAQDPEIAALLGCAQRGQVCTLNGNEEVNR